MNKDIQKKRIVTIAGRPGSGKSTASNALAIELGYEHFSSGDLFRALSKERGVDVHDANVAAEGGEDNIDYLVDQRLREIGSTQDEVVIDSRTAWHWIPQSFKIYLDLDLTTAAQRILSNMDPKRMEHEHIPRDPGEYAKRLQSRLDSENRRYKAMYHIDPYNLRNYDLVIDTEKNNPGQVLGQILDAYQIWIAS